MALHRRLSWGVAATTRDFDDDPRYPELIDTAACPAVGANGMVEAGAAEKPQCSGYAGSAMVNDC